MASIISDSFNTAIGSIGSAFGASSNLAMGLMPLSLPKIGAPIKGWLKNNETGNKMSFMFNPTSLCYGRTATYDEISAPGSSYPITQYIKGDSRNIPLNLFLLDKPATGKIDRYIAFFESCLPPEVNKKGYIKPPEMTFCLGTFVKKIVVTNLQVEIVSWNVLGAPTEAKVTLELKQVGV